MSGHRRLDSYHHDEREVVVNHDLGTFDPGPPRRLVLRGLAPRGRLWLSRRPPTGRSGASLNT